MSGGVPRLPLRLLPFKASPLFDRIVQFAEGVGHLHVRYVQLEPFDEVRVLGALFGQRGDNERIVENEGRLPRVSFTDGLEQIRQELAGLGLG